MRGGVSSSAMKLAVILKAMAIADHLPEVCVKLTAVALPALKSYSAQSPFLTMPAVAVHGALAVLIVPPAAEAANSSSPAPPGVMLGVLIAVPATPLLAAISVSKVAVPPDTENSSANNAVVAVVVHDAVSAEVALAGALSK